MFGAIILIVSLFILTQILIADLRKKHSFINISVLNILYWWHMLFAVIYYLYAKFNSSDSKRYFDRASNAYESASWGDIYEKGTKFIEFLAYPFVNYLSFSYEMMMILFAWVGYFGFVFFYLFFKENYNDNVKIFGISLLLIMMFLPNMHFWTASLGKEPIVFLGLALFAYAMNKPTKRLLHLVIGSLLVYNVRPHLFLFLGAGAVLGLLTGKDKIPLYQKFLVYSIFILVIFFKFNEILEYANLEENDILNSFDSFTTLQASRLSNAGSGVDMSNYSLPVKLFTFWFRPLFFDAPNFLGLYISMENLFYLVLTLGLINKQFIDFLRESPYLVKMSFIIFLFTSIALSYVMSNLGIIIRQKSMVMYFLFYVIIAYKLHIKQINQLKLNDGYLNEKSNRKLKVM